MALFTEANGFSSGPCPGGETELCVRLCWVNDCVSAWDLWVRWREEEVGDSEKWASYLNLGPVGALGFELSADVDKPGAEGSVCDSPEPICVLTPGSEGYAGEMICWCLEEDGNWPKKMDIVVNLFGADQFDCPDPLGDVCVEYFCDDGVTSGLVYSDTISGVFDFQGKGTAGNFGAGDYSQFVFEATGLTCFSEIDVTTEVSTCWVLSGMQDDGKMFISRGPGRAPKKFIIPDNVDPDSCILVEDGVEIPRGHYEVLQESEAMRAKVEVYSLKDLGYIRGRKCSAKKLPKKKRPCKNCKKKPKISLF